MNNEVRRLQLPTALMSTGMPRFLVTAIVALATAGMTGCGSTKSGLQIEAGQRFVLGGGSRGAFVVEARNVGPVGVAIYQKLPSGGSLVPLGSIDPGAVETLRFTAGSAAVLENGSTNTARLALSITGDQNLGMRYETLR